MGGILGVLLGAIITYAIRAVWDSLPATMSLFWASFGFLSAAAEGLLFGIYPGMESRESRPHRIPPLRVAPASRRLSGASSPPALKSNSSAEVEIEIENKFHISGC